MRHCALRSGLAVAFCLLSAIASAGTKTWDGRYDTSRIEVSVVYFVPSDRRPLPDWKDRVDYFCRRIEQFHHREFTGQSTLQTVVHPEPLISASTTAQLRPGDANAIWRRTLSETDRRIKFAESKGEREAFPILLVLSDINWRPLDDFYRLQPNDGKFVFEGIHSNGNHFPGAASGGARAAYIADRGVGWGLVSADGWRVPYRGTDCVVYHEGCGHTVGLPHPEPGNASVMSMGQYRGWISESWLDREQKVRLAWEPQEAPNDLQTRLYSTFRALPEPRLPSPGQAVQLAVDWPEDAMVKSLRVRYQTSLFGPWIEAPQTSLENRPKRLAVATFDRETPVSYRVDAELVSGETAEIWGYFQVRRDPKVDPQPWALTPDLVVSDSGTDSATPVQSIPDNEIDLLALTDPTKQFQVGRWIKAEGSLESPKALGARLELPYSPPEEYRLTLVVEPLDEINGLILGQKSGDRRFVTLFAFNRDGIRSAIENIDGRNVGNETTFEGPVLKKGVYSQVIVTVRKSGVTMSVDGRLIVNWKGDRSSLSLSDYWRIPREDALFLGAYDCRYRFHRISLQPISGAGKRLSGE